MSIRDKEWLKKWSEFFYKKWGVYPIAGGEGTESEEPEVKYTQPPEYERKQKLFEEIQEPWMRKQFKLFQDVFEPQTRTLGGILGKEIEQPLSLPEDVWANIWQKGRERTVGEFAPIRQQAGERFAGKGMLNQPITEKYFQTLDLAQAKSVEDLAIDMAIQEWQEKKLAKQQAINNVQGFLNYQPSFQLEMPESQSLAFQPTKVGAWERFGLPLLETGTKVAAAKLMGGA